MKEKLSILPNIAKTAEHSLLGMFLKLAVRINGGFREGIVSGIAERVAQKGYIDPLSQDELDLLPKRIRTEAFHRINIGLIERRFANG